MRPFLIKTQMKAVTEAVPVIKLVPRLYPILTDDLMLTLDNGVVLAFDWEISKNTIVITLEDTSGFVQGTTYSFTINRNQEIIYKGKIIFLADDTDIQNYTNQSQNTKRWK